MPLEPGTTLGPYAVTAKIGQGGMGEVWQARDTKLDRDVALKVLPEAFTSDPDRLARFEREAKVLASLNHPNIGAIHGFEESGDTKALVLELVEGPTLADRIAEGPVPVDEALPIAKQIAEALEAAHEQGVIHRDLKPANVKVRDDGTVKVLDFGLAKAFQPGGSSDPSDSPTITASATASGVIMGTAAYMSPEQARGKPVDKRSDIWAFGAVLYEMLSGRRPFDGRDVSEVLGAVLRLEPDWDALPGDAPPRVSTLVRRCVEKEPKQRLHDIADVRLAMEGAFEPSVGTRDEPVGVPHLQIWQRPIPLAVAALGLVILTGLGVWSATRPTVPPAESVRRFALNIGQASPIPIANLHAMPAWSPDGTRLIYAANVAGTHQLYLRTLDDLEPRPIAGTENAVEPFFSPDGEWVGFSVAPNLASFEGEFKRVAVRGGTPLTLCECLSLAGATWLADGTIIVTHRTGGVLPTLHRIPEAGGTPELLTTADAERGELGHLWPHALPGGTDVLFTILTSPSGNALALDARASVAVLSLDTGEHHIVIEDGYNARYVPTGHLVFGRQGALWGVPFDLDRLATTGPEEVLLQGIEVNEVYGAMALSVSGDGTLVYWPGDAVGVDMGSILRGGRPVWVDRAGQATPIGEGRRNNAVHPRLSPDNTQLAMTVTSTDGPDVWVDDLERGTSTRLTNDGNSRHPAWSPDGARIAFGAFTPPFGLHSRAADGSGERETVVTGEQRTVPFGWTPSEGGAMFVFWFLTQMYARFWVVEGPPCSGRGSGCRSWRS